MPTEIEFLPEDAEFAEVNLHKPTILIVDDSELIRDVLANIFEETYFIKMAENGQEGLDLLRENRSTVCAILLDVNMPVMNGLTMLKALREEHITEDIPVFLITGEATPDVIKEAYELGVMDVIPKPGSDGDGGNFPRIVKRRVNSVIELFITRRRLAGIVDQQKDTILQQAGRILQLSIGMIESLSTAIEFRSGESGEHVRRIHDITELFLVRSSIGKNFTPEEIKHISLAAIMHDVGKISVPDAILNKPGRLTPEEFEIMKTHTTLGRQLLEKIPQMKEMPFFNYAYDIAHFHHERWDGRGYPLGLKGDEIPLWAQIVSIADVYDALVSKRVYKKAFHPDQACAMIVNGECGCFNPVLLEAFRGIEGRVRQLYPKNTEEPASSPNAGAR